MAKPYLIGISLLIRSVPRQPSTLNRTMTDALTQEQVREILEDLYQAESRRIFATLVRLLGDFDLAEDALNDAFRAVLEQWPRAGLPTNPRAWLVSAGRFQMIDALRKRARFDAAMGALTEELQTVAPDLVEPSFDRSALHHARPPSQCGQCLMA